MSPKIGPSDGEGYIYFYGQHFRDDFKDAELGCKIGESIG